MAPSMEMEPSCCERRIRGRGVDGLKWMKAKRCWLVEKEEKERGCWWGCEGREGKELADGMKDQSRCGVWNANRDSGCEECDCRSKESKKVFFDHRHKSLLSLDEAMMTLCVCDSPRRYWAGGSASVSIQNEIVLQTKPAMMTTAI